MAEPLDDRLARLSAAKRDLYERLRATRGGAAADRPAGGEPLLSFAQERFWFLERLEPGNPAHHIAGCTRLVGPLDRAALAAALTALSARHEVLRTTFPDRDGAPLQRIGIASPVHLETVELAGGGAERRASVLRRITQAPFDLSRDPPWRSALLVHGPRAHELVTCFHHIAADAVSIGIVWRELVELYAAAVERRAPRLAAPTWQARDHARWQRERLRSGALATSIDYWLGELAGVDLLELPAERERARDWQSRGEPARLGLGAGTLARLRELAARRGVTLHMLLLAAFGGWLARRGGVPEIAIGVPVASRSRPELAGMVGLCVNSVVLRLDARGDPSFLELLAHVRERSIAALAHAEVPFEHLVERLAPQRRLDRNPLFQVMFNLIDFVDLAATAGELRFEGRPLHSGTQLDLALDAWVREDALHLELETDPGLYEAGSGTRLLEEFGAWLARALEEPERRLSQCDPTLERARSFESGEPAGEGPTLVEEFERQAALRPTAVAIESELGRLDYAQALRAVERLELGLRASGVRDADIVAVELPRCAERVLLPLALWRIGARYVPFDPAWPPARSARLRERLSARLVVDVQRLREWMQLDGTEPLPAAGAASAAAVFFTSGSTGEPKGVLLAAASFANHARWVGATFGLGPGTRVLHWTSPGFDASLWETLPALASGACVVLAPDGVEHEPARLAAFTRAARIDVLQLVPPLLGEWLDALAATSDGGAAVALTHVVSGGEALPVSLARRFFERFPRAGRAVQLWNLYGPTEACIDALATRVEPSDAELRAILIGRPIRGAHVRIAAADGTPCGIGTVGELWIAGEGLALGYWRATDAEARRFTTDASGRRWYHSGDRARWRDDGRVEFLGRLDRQLKLRGQRIEPGEIEAALAAHPLVEHAHVAVRTLGAVEALVAWYKARDGECLPENALLDFLAERLPRGWLPARCLAIERWPLGVNGKLDARALPDPERGPETAIAGADELTQLVAAQFAAVLDAQGVQPDGDFFALGGHSLLAARVVARLSQVLERDVPLRELFAHPTPRGLARALAAPATDRAAEAIRARGERAELIAASGELRLWFLQRLEPASTAYLMAGALALRGDLDEHALELAITALVERHESLRTLYPERDGRPRPRLCPVEQAARLERVERTDRAAALAWIGTRLCRPLHLGEEAPLRVGLARCGAHEHLLAFVLHHVAGDGISLDILLREFAVLYAALRRGDSVPLAPPRLQPSDRAAWLERYERSDRARADLEAWRTALQGIPHVLDLPAVRTRAPGRARPCGRIEFTLAPEASAKLRALGARLGATPQMILCASWALVLGRSAGTRALAIGVASSGRQRPELEGLVAFCVNLLPLPVRWDEHTSFEALVSGLRRDLLAALAREDLSFEHIVDGLGVHRDPLRPPLVQASFAWHAQPIEEPVLDGLRTELIELAPAEAKLELALEVVARGERVECRLDWDAGLWDELQARGFAEAWQAVLEDALARPALSCEALAWVDTAARKREAELAAGPPAPVIAAPLFVARWLGHAHRMPTGLALVDGPLRWTHGELERASAGFASRLRERGVRRGDAVGIVLSRSWRSVVAFVGTWRAGAVAVPLDPEQPEERLRSLLGEAQAVVALLEPARAAISGSACACFSADDEWFKPLGESFAEAELAPTDCAYLIFTSGTTGLPKAVEVTHGALAFHIDWMHRELGFGPATRAIHRLAPVFDAALFETADALACGGACIVAAPDEVGDPRALARLIERERATMLITLPSLFEWFSANPLALADMGSLQDWICGGEALSTRATRAWIAAAERVGLRCRLWNFYGPTEATVHCVTHRVDGSERGESVPIGLPLAGTTACVLDERGRELPRGWTGELWLGGPNLARGYRNRAELTERAFVLREGERLYRSGDLVRRDERNELVFVGRRDSQVKLRGRRIELGEIESALAAHSLVREAVVVRVREPEDHLVAHVLSANAPDERVLCDWLASRLPRELVPQRIVAHAELPRLASGKPDRAALTRWRLSAPQDGAAEAQGGLELLVARAMGNALTRAPLGRDEDYFEAGGSSLSAIGVIASLEGALGREIRVRWLFEHPTPRTLAARLGAGADADRPELELEPLAKLDARWAPVTGEPATGAAIRHVLLTGATGFLGAFLLAELLERSQARVTCLVRAEGDQRALERVRATLRTYGLEPDRSALERIDAYAADLAASELGLSVAVRERLAADVDLVLHCGARVHFVAGYAELAPENVGGTCALLELATRGRPKALHFVSTLGVAGARGIGPADTVGEDTPLERLARQHDGYEQTKWVAERMLTHARARGFAVAVHRPGRVAAHSTRGVCNPTDAAGAFVRGCARLGAVPRLGGALDFTPVDHVASAIVALALQRPARGETWHHCHPLPTPVALVVDALAERVSGLSVLPIADWRARLRAQALLDEQHPLRALLPLFLDDRDGARAEESLLPDLALPRIDATRTRTALAALGLDCPALDAEWARRWVGALLQAERSA